MSTFVKGRNTNGGSVGITSGSGNTDKVFDLENIGIGGEGYAWVDETANRVFGTTYTNTLIKPISILINTSSNGSGDNNTTLFINDIQVDRAYERSTGAYNWATVSAIIPSGSTYRVEILSGIIETWNELK